MDKHLLEARDNIIESAGRTTQGFGLGRIIGQLYALLFFSPSPLSLDQMAGELKISKGSASTNIRELEKWGAVRRVWVKGDRKDYYEAEIDYLKILRTGVFPFIKRKLNSSSTTTMETRELIKSSDETLDQEAAALADFYSERLSVMEKAQQSFSLLLKFPGL